MQLETLKYLEDMRLAAERIKRFSAGKGVRDYNSDDMLRSAIERQFEVIGEALNQLRRTDEHAANRISEQRRIIAFRNQLIHGYRYIDDEIVWDVIQKDLPVLHREILELMAEGDPGSSAESDNT